MRLFSRTWQKLLQGAMNTIFPNKSVIPHILLFRHFAEMSTKFDKTRDRAPKKKKGFSSIYRDLHIDLNICSSQNCRVFFKSFDGLFAKNSVGCIGFDQTLSFQNQS